MGKAALNVLLFFFGGVLNFDSRRIGEVTNRERRFVASGVFQPIRNGIGAALTENK